MGELRTYTVHDRPDDHPNLVVVREFVIRAADPEPRPGRAWFYTSVAAAEADLERAELARLERHPSDPPQVVATWL